MVALLPRVFIAFTVFAVCVVSQPKQGAPPEPFKQAKAEPNVTTGAPQNVLIATSGSNIMNSALINGAPNASSSTTSTTEAPKIRSGPNNAGSSSGMGTVSGLKFLVTALCGFIFYSHRVNLH